MLLTSDGMWSDDESCVTVTTLLLLHRVRISAKGVSIRNMQHHDRLRSSRINIILLDDSETFERECVHICCELSEWVEVFEPKKMKRLVAGVHRQYKLVDNVPTGRIPAHAFFVRRMGVEL